MTHPVLDLHPHINLEPGPLQAGRQLFDWNGLQQLVGKVIGVSRINRKPSLIRFKSEILALRTFVFPQSTTQLFADLGTEYTAVTEHPHDVSLNTTLGSGHHAGWRLERRLRTKSSGIERQQGGRRSGSLLRFYQETHMRSTS